MDDLLSKYLKTRKALVKPKQPNLGEMNRSLKTTTAHIPKPVTFVPFKSIYGPTPTTVKHSDTISTLTKGDSIFTTSTPGGNPDRQTSYIDNNYAGDDYVD